VSGAGVTVDSRDGDTPVTPGATQRAPRRHTARARPQATDSRIVFYLFNSNGGCPKEKMESKRRKRKRKEKKKKKKKKKKSTEFSNFHHPTPPRPPLKRMQRHPP
jgi:hypothetical protein